MTEVNIPRRQQLLSKTTSPRALHYGKPWSSMGLPSTATRILCRSRSPWCACNTDCRQSKVNTAQHLWVGPEDANCCVRDDHSTQCRDALISGLSRKMTCHQRQRVHFGCSRHFVCRAAHALRQCHLDSREPASPVRMLPSE